MTPEMFAKGARCASRSLIDFTCGVSYIGCEKEKLGEVAEWFPEGTHTEEGASLGCFMDGYNWLKTNRVI